MHGNLALASLPAWTPARLVFVLVVAGVAGVAAWRLASREFATASARQVAYAVVLTAIAAALGHLSVPVGGARPAPSQHLVNLVAAVTLGPWWATLIAFAAAVIRNATGAGTVLAFPGGMIGALLAGLAWRATRSLRVDSPPPGPGRPSILRGERIGLAATALAEVVGSGLIGAVVSGWLVAPLVMGRETTASAYVSIFAISSLTGVVLGLLVLVALRRAEVLRFDTGA